MIRLENVTKKYPLSTENIKVLSSIELTINKGELLSIMGPSGSGKSTLMSILGCLDRPTTGGYFLQGQNVSNMKEVELAQTRNKLIGFIFQQFHLLPRFTVLQNVELPMIYSNINRKQRIELAEQAIEKVGLLDYKNHLPNTLSGGQKQRVAIARAIINQPILLLADEPTGSLDTKTSYVVMELISSLNQEGTTVVLVTHDANIASYTERTIFIRDGEIVENERIT
ncbi:macrolide ABC transporter ATP-binding protein [Virgibacillus dokdonensis]|uniref:Macrolide ABC transporter ATP-binding protein n=1 Tax=Virgibacillus dokdonensis TaxID=302167 RepID=A0A3E0WL46_9BACI|nr:ABC transporter ATP-binding protein [Virgibacillus dokdonensis]RFA33129.1 macrolide ABC transporter ATP-binding protein [Virgibacillus dokdonensis]